MITVLGVIIDQLSKFIITNSIELNEMVTIIEDFFFLRHIRNTGAAWGIMSSNTLILALISIVFLFFLINYIEKMKEISKISQISFGLIIGGIIGNLIDRLLRGYVVDFFSFIIFKYHYPIFNIADILIVVGAFLLIIEFVLTGDDKSGKRK